MKRAGFAVFALFGLVVASCAPPPPVDRPDLTVGLGDLDAIRERGVLRVLVPVVVEPELPRNGAPQSEDRAMAVTFAERLGVEAEFIAIDSRTDLLTLLESGFADIVTAQLTVTAPRQKRVRFTRPTATVSEWLVGKRDVPDLPRRVDELEGWPVHVRASSAFTETLTNLSRETGIPVRVVPVEESLDTETIAYEVSQGHRPLTVVDSNLLASIEAYNQDLERLFVLAEGRQLAWAVRREAEALASAANTFIIEHYLTDHRTDDLSTGDLDEILERGSLRVITLNNPVNYFLYRGRMMGFDYEMATHAADRLGVRLEMVVPPSRDLVFDWLLEGRGDIIASTLTVTPERQQTLAFTRPYIFINELVVQSAEVEEPVQDIFGLEGRSVYAWPSSSHYQTLLDIERVVGPFDIVPIPEDVEFEEILDRVATGEFSLTVVDSHILQAELRYRDDVKALFPLVDPRDPPEDRHTVISHDKAVAFAVRPENVKLAGFINELIDDMRGSFDYGVIRNRYFEDNLRLPRVKARRAAVTGRLSPYDELFKVYADRYGLDWRLMAAQSYQESGFDPDAESWAGAQGLFQLLPSTALELGFEDLHDPETGIHAGVKYMNLLLDRLDPRIPLKHRLRFALAAYNAGWGHLDDARRLADEKGWDRDKWFGHTERAMLLLRQPQYYREARHGYVRGTEPGELRLADSKPLRPLCDPRSSIRWHNRSPMSSSIRILVVLAMSSAVSVSAQTTRFEDVLPIFETSCTFCHGPDLQESQLRLDSEAFALQGGVSGEAVTPGDAESSLLVHRLTGVAEPSMPMGGEPLSAEELALIRAWIESLETVAAVERSQTHWAYIKPAEPELPTVKNDAWVRNPIDAFVLAGIEREGLTPSADATKEALIRRLSLDLIGLPPTLDEVDAFVADDSPGAYDALVDRLLSSPHYGERWARPWLDLARYADTQGYEKDGPRTIWKYRDWVIDALNDDMSFRDFTIEQIAGDMLPHATPSQRVATGFHRNTLLNQEGGVDDEEARWETLVDRVNTTATTWLGQTLACAQCHNHKFDPFSQRDYYEFLAFFDNSAYEILKLGQGESWVVEPELALPTVEQKERADAIEAELEGLALELETPTPELEADQPRWEAAMRRAPSQWTVLRPRTVRSRGGATLSVLDDGSVLASGDNPEADTYTFTADVDVDAVTAFRLEVIEDASLPHGGPGRDEEGNFFLSDFEVDVDGVSVELDEAVANDAQFAYGVERAISKRPGSGGWAIDKTSSPTPLPRQAVFVPAEPVSGDRITVRLKHDMRRAARNLGRFRLSIASPDDIDEPIAIVRLPARLAPILDIEPGTRTEEQWDSLAAAYRSVSPLLDPVRERIAELEAELVALDIPTTLVLAERDSYARPSTPFRIRGSFLSPGERVYADVPAALPELPADQMPNRLGLAHWLVDADNPLTARVTVNRLWEQLFGRGIVETSENFGTQGSPPSHPELLDWLATRFMADGWSLKSMLRTMVTSSTYRQLSAAPAESWERDPYNRWLARGPRFRIEAEMVRDVTLAVSGLLSDKIGGPSVYPYQPEGVWNRPYSSYRWMLSSGEDRYRRALYTFMRRTAPYPSLTTFDAPSREFCTARRVQTNTPLQALTTLNDPVYFEAAQNLASRMLREVSRDVRARASHGFRLAVSRYPTDAELDHLVRYYAEERARFDADKVAAFEATAGVWDGRDDVADVAAWTMVANVLLNLDETVTKE